MPCQVLLLTIFFANLLALLVLERMLPVKEGSAVAGYMLKMKVWKWMLLAKVVQAVAGQSAEVLWLRRRPLRCPLLLVTGFLLSPRVRKWMLPVKVGKLVAEHGLTVMNQLFFQRLFLIPLAVVKLAGLKLLKVLVAVMVLCLLLVLVVRCRCPRRRAQARSTSLWSVAALPGRWAPTRWWRVVR